MPNHRPLSTGIINQDHQLQHNSTHQNYAVKTKNRTITVFPQKSEFSIHTFDCENHDENRKKKGNKFSTETVRPRKMSREATRFGLEGFWSEISGSDTMRWCRCAVSALISAIFLDDTVSSTVVDEWYEDELRAVAKLVCNLQVARR